MTRNQRAKLLRRSADWIHKHPDALNVDVPKDLLARWYIEVGRNDDPHSLALALQVFLLGHSAARIDAPGREYGYSIADDELDQLFEVWQFVLQVAWAFQRGAPLPLEYAAMDLFRFPPGFYENLKHAKANLRAERQRAGEEPPDASTNQSTES